MVEAAQEKRSIDLQNIKIQKIWLSLISEPRVVYENLKLDLSKTFWRSRLSFTRQLSCRFLWEQKSYDFRHYTSTVLFFILSLRCFKFHRATFLGYYTFPTVYVSLLLLGYAYVSKGALHMNAKIFILCLQYSTYVLQKMFILTHFRGRTLQRIAATSSLELRKYSVGAVYILSQLPRIWPSIFERVTTSVSR